MSTPTDGVVKAKKKASSKTKASSSSSGGAGKKKAVRKVRVIQDLEVMNDDGEPMYTLLLITHQPIIVMT